jgi:hypothetical protein
LHWVLFLTNTHNRTLLFCTTLLKHGRHFDYWKQPPNMRIRVCYLDYREAGLCCYVVINVESLLHVLQHCMTNWRVLDLRIEFIGPLHNWLQQFTNHYLTYCYLPTEHPTGTSLTSNWTVSSESKYHCDWRSVSHSVLVSIPGWVSWSEVSSCLKVTVF